MLFNRRLLPAVSALALASPAFAGGVKPVAPDANPSVARSRIDAAVFGAKGEIESLSRLPPLHSREGGTGFATIPGSSLFGLGGAIMSGGQIIEVEAYRLASDGPNWGPAIQRAVNAAMTIGGTVRVSTAGTLQIATQVSILQGHPFVAFTCASRATTLQAASSLLQYMFAIGPPSANGGVNVDITGCSFRGATKATALGFYLNNANSISFKGVTFSNFMTALNSSNGYGITLDDVTFQNVKTPFTSSTAAHGLVARRVKCYTCGNVFNLGGFSYSIDIEDGDFEGVKSVLTSSGGAALRFVGNYLERPTSDPIYNSAAMDDAVISGNYLSYGSADWYMSNFVGGIFSHNSLYNLNVYAAATSSDIEFGDNSLGGTAQIGTSPFKTPTLTNGWLQQTGYSPVGYRRGSNGRVYLQGNLTNATAALGTAAFNLPAAYRPTTQRTFLSGGPNASTTYVNIGSDGDVVIARATGAGTIGSPYLAGLDAINFEPGQ